MRELEVERWGAIGIEVRAYGASESKRFIAQNTAGVAPLSRIGLDADAGDE